MATIIKQRRNKKISFNSSYTFKELYIKELCSPFYPPQYPEVLLDLFIQFSKSQYIRGNQTKAISYHLLSIDIVFRQHFSNYILLLFLFVTLHIFVLHHFV